MRNITKMDAVSMRLRVSSFVYLFVVSIVVGRRSESVSPWWRVEGIGTKLLYSIYAAAGKMKSYKHSVLLDVLMPPVWVGSWER
jgi:hypothetical protein